MDIERPSTSMHGGYGDMDMAVGTVPSIMIHIPDMRRSNYPYHDVQICILVLHVRACILAKGYK